MFDADNAAVVLLGALVLAIIYLTIQVQALRVQIQPLTSSSLAQGIARI